MHNPDVMTAALVGAIIGAMYGGFFGFVWGVMYSHKETARQIQRVLQAKIDKGELIINPDFLQAGPEDDRLPYEGSGYHSGN